ncbi:MAG: hypothetical protein DHS20C15_24250 [Planctomycetota bacterium]|nr:MAG: hypothetical protein DHS20C15_24250 [Planctomycetota bacterium]
MTITAHLLALLRSALVDRQRLVLENLALRQQVAMLRRGVKRPRVKDRDRIFWIGMLRLLSAWRDSLNIVQPDTVVRWHRAGWRAYWRRNSKPHTFARAAVNRLGASDANQAAVA